MKTKTIEAMMFRKTIVGTSEAFSGIENPEEIGYICNTTNQFIDILNGVVSKKGDNARNHYLKNYEESKADVILVKIVSEC